MLVYLKPNPTFRLKAKHSKTERCAGRFCSLSDRDFHGTRCCKPGKQELHAREAPSLWHIHADQPAEFKQLCNHRVHRCKNNGGRQQGLKLWTRVEALKNDLFGILVGAVKKLHCSSSSAAEYVSDALQRPLDIYTARHQGLAP